MYVIESIRISLNAIRVNKMRSILTMLGIIIGIASVIAVFAIGNGGEAAINKEFESFGLNRLMLLNNYDMNGSQRDMMILEDVNAIERVMGEELVGVSPSNSESLILQQRTEKKSEKPLNVTAKGISHQYNQIESIDLLEGRFLIENDYLTSRNVTVIPDTFAKAVFGRTDVVGEKVSFRYKNQSLVLSIVGVQKTKTDGLFASFGQSYTVYVPFTTLNKVNGMGDYVTLVELNTKDETDKKALEIKIKALLSQRHRNDPEMYSFYSIQNELEAVNSVTGIVTGIISAVAAISLLVGGIGVMNIMLVSVTERTKEIGIRKALGARRRDILLQFLVESVIISLIGGIVGTGIGVSISMIASHYLKLPSIVPMNAVIIAWAFSAGVGIFFGLYPANKAAKLDPIEALRYE